MRKHTSPARRALFMSSLLLGCSGALGGTSSSSPFEAKVAFKCKEDGPQAVGCTVGEAQLSLDIFDQGMGEVGLRLLNQGKHKSIVSEIYLVDEAGLLRPESLTMQGDGLINYRQSKKEHDFPALSADDKQPLKADVALLRRKEVSKIGRFLRSNGMSNKGGPLTLSMKTTNAALDAELVTEASHECLLRLAVVMTSFDADPGAKTTFLSHCLPST